MSDKILDLYSNKPCYGGFKYAASMLMNLSLCKTHAEARQFIDDMSERLWTTDVGSLAPCACPATDQRLYSMGKDGWGAGVFLAYPVFVERVLADNPEVQADGASARVHDFQIQEVPNSAPDQCFTRGLDLVELLQDHPRYEIWTAQ